MIFGMPRVAVPDPGRDAVPRRRRGGRGPVLRGVGRRAARRAHERLGPSRPPSGSRDHRGGRACGGARLPRSASPATDLVAGRFVSRCGGRGGCRLGGVPFDDPAGHGARRPARPAVRHPHRGRRGRSADRRRRRPGSSRPRSARRSPWSPAACCASSGVGAARLARSRVRALPARRRGAAGPQVDGRLRMRSDEPPHGGVLGNTIAEEARHQRRHSARVARVAEGVQGQARAAPARGRDPHASARQARRHPVLRDATTRARASFPGDGARARVRTAGSGSRGRRRRRASRPT